LAFKIFAFNWKNMGRKMVGPKNDDDDNQNVYLKCAPGNTFGAALVPRPLSPQS